jgi:hypothetical protein
VRQILTLALLMLSSVAMADQTTLHSALAGEPHGEQVMTVGADGRMLSTITIRRMAGRR